MYTEDDTFDKLRRVPYTELNDLIMREDPFIEGDIFAPFEPSEVAWLKKYGWTELEYKKAYRSYLLSKYNDLRWMGKLD